jgi:hypothetical protein
LYGIRFSTNQTVDINLSPAAQLRYVWSSMDRSFRGQEIAE